MGQEIRWTVVLVTAAWASGPGSGSSAWHLSSATGVGERRGSSAAVDDRIVFPSGLKDAAVLVRGQRSSGDCLDGQVAKSLTFVSVGDLVAPTVCPSEVAGFSRDKGMTLQHPNWSAVDDAVNLNPGPPRLAVELNVYIAAQDQKAAKRTAADITRAVRLFKRNRVGIRFNAVHFVSAASASDRSVIGAGCANAGGLKSAGLPLFDPTRVNLYVVDTVKELINGTVLDSWRGYNCYEHAAENVLYLSVQYRSPTTLTHEFGHLLGLRDPCGHPGHGGLTSIAGFTPSNIMWSNLSDAEAKAQNHFSLGQAYRMNTDEQSWLNRATGAAGQAIRSGETRKCLSGPPVPTDDCPPVTPAKDDPCPPLAADVTGGS
jgi:hypothetical protein